jgi:hypothetical protein
MASGGTADCCGSRTLEHAYCNCIADNPFGFSHEASSLLVTVPEVHAALNTAHAAPNTAHAALNTAAVVEAPEIEGPDNEDPETEGTPSNSFPCNACEKVFTNKRTLKTHVSDRHVGTQCHWPGCGYTTTDELNLIHHFHEHQRDAVEQGFDKKKCPWPGCPKTYSRGDSVQRCIKRHNAQV